MAITAYLLYEDVAGALKFLSKAFGFKKHGRPMSGSDGKLQHASMQLDKDFIMMGYPGPEYKSPRRLGQATMNLYVNVSDVDKHYKRAKKAGARILEEPQDTFYGHRRYGAADPKGHEWYFAHEIKKPARPTRPTKKK